MGTLRVKLQFDTSAHSALVRGDQAILDLLSRAVEVCIAVVAIGELLSGFYGGSRRAENIARLEKFLKKPSVRVLPVTAETAIRYAEVDNFLRTKAPHKNNFTANDVAQSLTPMSLTFRPPDVEENGMSPYRSLTVAAR